MNVAAFVRSSLPAAALLAICGCAAIHVNPSVAQYHAFGDSITYGQTLSDPAGQAYPALISDSDKIPFSNYARQGDMACDVAARQIIPNAESPALNSPRKYTLLIGTSDVDAKGPGSYEPIFVGCQQAAISWLAIPAEDKILAGQKGFQATGPGTIHDPSGWQVWTTQGAGSTVSFAVTTTQAGPIYAWPVLDDNSPATFAYSLDGIALGTGSALGGMPIVTANGTTRTLGFLRFPSVAAGSHTVTFTQLNSGMQGVSVLGVGVPQAPTSGFMPVVLVGTIPYQVHTGAGSGCQSDDSPCLAYIRDIESTVGLLSGDGLNVHIFETRQFLQGTADDMSDAIHPNAKGQDKIRQAVQAAWNLAN